MKKENNKVIYTCLVGDYDELLQPRKVDVDFDYICFSNDIKEEKVGVWNIRSIPFDHVDSTRLSRYVKLNPHLVLSEYEYSIWIDANIQIIDSLLYDRAKELITKNTIVSQVQHPFYNCIYKDIIECIRFHKDKFRLMVEQYNFLKREGFPENYGLFENNLIFRKHNDPLIIQVSEMWWEIYSQYAKRDQFSLCFVYWKIGVSPVLFLPDGMSLRSCNDFVYRLHNKTFTLQEKIKFYLFSRYNRGRLFFRKNEILLK